MDFVSADIFYRLIDNVQDFFRGLMSPLKPKGVIEDFDYESLWKTEEEKEVEEKQKKEREGITERPLTRGATVGVRMGDFGHQDFSRPEDSASVTGMYVPGMAGGIAPSEKYQGNNYQPNNDLQTNQDNYDPEDEGSTPNFRLRRS